LCVSREKAKLFLCWTNQALPREDVWGPDVQIQVLLTSVLLEGEWSASRSDCLTPEKSKPQNRSGWYGKMKFFILPALELWTLDRPASNIMSYITVNVDVFVTWLYYSSDVKILFRVTILRKININIAPKMATNNKK
jgi:hypothetical protein